MEEIIKDLREVAERCDLDNDYDMNDCAEDVREIANNLEQAVTKCNQFKMREALKYLRDASREFCHLIINSKYNAIFDKYKHPEVAKIGDAIAYAGDVLAEPPRNCDVGTPREQAERFNDFCNSHYSLNNPEGVCSECPLTRDGSTCEFEWLQLPYKKEGEE